MRAAAHFTIPAVDLTEVCYPFCEYGSHPKLMICAKLQAHMSSGKAGFEGGIT